MLYALCMRKQKKINDFLWLCWQFLWLFRRLLQLFCFAYYAVQISSPQYKTLITFFRGGVKVSLRTALLVSKITTWMYETHKCSLRPSSHTTFWQAILQLKDINKKIFCHNIVVAFQNLFKTFVQKCSPKHTFNSHGE
jgi:hypothetical protein